MPVTIRDQRFTELDALIKAGLGDIPGETKHRHVFIKHGYHRNGQRRLRCKGCRTTVLSGDGETPAQRKKVSIIDSLLVPGATIRTVARRLGAAIDTVRFYAKVIPRPPCPCGQSAGHRGWCTYRFQLSPSRQLVIAKFQERRKP